MPRSASPADAFRTHPLGGDGGEDWFAALSGSVAWEDLGKGRRGAVLTRVDAAGRLPLVRTTTRYRGPAQRFRPVHERLARRIGECAALPGEGFDNALVEAYTNAYTTMGAHSDQALDLADGSSIAVFSCYRDPAAGPPRTLVVEAKEPGGEPCRIPLVHHGAVVFTVEANRRHRHRIVLDAPPGGAAENTWLGVTFRTSKTLLRFDPAGGVPRLPDGRPLAVADEAAGREFYGLRRRENREADFRWPPLACTVSASDLLPPV